MAVVVFNQKSFLERYPEFNATLALEWNTKAAVLCFSEACIYLDNTDVSRIPVAQRETLLNMLTAHILALNFGVNGKTPTDLVGVVTNASEGSVSVGASMGSGMSETAAWYNQTKYGAAYYRASRVFASALYRPPTCGPQVIITREG
jgi:hypothetical protein